MGIVLIEHNGTLRYHTEGSLAYAFVGSDLGARFDTCDHGQGSKHDMADNWSWKARTTADTLRLSYVLHGLLEVAYSKIRTPNDVAISYAIKDALAVHFSNIDTEFALN